MTAPAPLRLCRDIDIPIDVVTQKLAWLGTTGSGKTYAATKLAELLWGAGAQFAALDTMGIWYGLRFNKDRSGLGIPIPIFGGRYGDLPLRPQDGHLLAEVIVDRGISAILDLSGLETDSQKAKFASDFADRLYRLKTQRPSAIHIFLEEAHEFIPQNPQPGEAQMLHHFNRLWKQGRNYGIGGSIITQRPQDVNKKASELSAAVFAFNVSGTNALKAVQDWTKAPEAAELPKLPMGKEAGKCLVWSPSWLDFVGFDFVPEKQTYHASFDPFAAVEVDAGDRSLPPVAVEALRDRFAEIEDEEKENDPKTLKAKIKDLEKRLADGGDSAREAELEAKLTDAIRRADRLGTVLQIIERKLGETISLIDANGVSNFPKPAPRAGEDPGKASSKPEVRARPRPVAALGLPQEILDAIAFFEQVKVAHPRREHVGAYLGKSASGGYFTRVVGELKTSGLIEYPSQGRLALTEEGRAKAELGPAMKLKDLHRHWIDKVGGLGGQILALAIENYPAAITREWIGSQLGKSEAGGYFTRIVGELKSAGFIAYPDKGRVVATDLLFPEGLR